jgi:hypothetical protein
MHIAEYGTGEFVTQNSSVLSSRALYKDGGVGVNIAKTAMGRLLAVYRNELDISMAPDDVKLMVEYWDSGKLLTQEEYEVYNDAAVVRTMKLIIPCLVKEYCQFPAHRNIPENFQPVVEPEVQVKYGSYHGRKDRTIFVKCHSCPIARVLRYGLCPILNQAGVPYEIAAMSVSVRILSSSDEDQERLLEVLRRDVHALMIRQCVPRYQLFSYTRCDYIPVDLGKLAISVPVTEGAEALVQRFSTVLTSDPEDKTKVLVTSPLVLAGREHIGSFVVDTVDIDDIRAKERAVYLTATGVVGVVRSSSIKMRDFRIVFYIAGYKRLRFEPFWENYFGENTAICMALKRQCMVFV